MKRKLIAVVFIVLLLLSGCDATDAGKENAALTIVVGIHSNGAVIPFNSETLKTILWDACYRHGLITFINVDKDPEPYCQVNITETSVHGLSKEKQKTIADEYMNELLDILKRGEADSPEVDTLKAITKGAQSLEDPDDRTYDKTLLVLDSGLSTSGYLDFTKGLLYADTDELITALKEEKVLPNLTNVNVVWFFCGDVVYPQAALTEDERSRLKAIWKEILLAGGANSVAFKSDFSISEAYEGLPEVSIVDVGKENLYVNAAKMEKAANTIVLSNTRVQFVGNSAEFLDEENAVESIREVAKFLDENPEINVYVVGTTASGPDNPDFCKNLSEKRAIAVVEVMTEAGIDEKRLIPIGLGFEDYWHVEDIDENGNLIETNAARNRKVLIIDVNSEDAALIP